MMKNILKNTYTNLKKTNKFVSSDPDEQDHARFFFLQTADLVAWIGGERATFVK
jgi:hypothetical protein